MSYFLSFFSNQAQPAADQTNQQPGSNHDDAVIESAPVVNDGKSEQDKAKEVEELRKLLAAKEADLAALKAQNGNPNDENTTADGGNDDDEAKAPHKMDVTLSIRGIPEYDSYPYAMASDKFYYMASIKAPYFREDDRAPIDLVAVVDESGSMSGDSIKLVRQTIKFIIKNLESGDRFGIVGYSSGSREVLPLTRMDDAGKKKAQQLASNLKAQGGTALCKGLVDGVNMMRQRTSKNEIASVMILTDGHANQGPTSAAEINRSVRQGKVVSGGYGNMVTKEEDEDDAKQQPEGSNELPCTINTFGLGTGHNALLLKALAENGRGMYAFIEKSDQIAETFAECLGGLVSVVGQNLKVQVQALNNVQISRCLSKGYPVNVDIPRKKHTISVKDVQSEESRDFVFELKVPQIEAEKKEDPLIQLSVNYDNVVRGSTETLTNICNIHRIDGKQIGERNLELDLQYNRVLAANAMEEANKLAKGGQLNDARRVLTTAQEHIKKSRTNQDEFCIALVEDMQKCQSNMVDHSSYRSRGAKVLGCGARSHMRQRAAQPRYKSHQAYRGATKGRMVSKAKASSPF